MVYDLSAKESEALQLWHTVQELELERAILRAESQVSEPPVEDENLDAALSKAQQELLQARAEYTLREKIANSVLCVDPTLKAVHDARSADLLQKRMPDMITDRDIATLRLTASRRALQTSINELSECEVQVRALDDQNSQLAGTLLRLTEQNTLRSSTAAGSVDAALETQLKTLDIDLKKARRRLETDRTLFSCLIVNSGIDWVHGEEGFWIKYVLADS